MGDLLHDAYGGGEQPRVPAPRREDDERDSSSVVDRIRSWSGGREAVAICTGLVLAVPAIGRRRAASARHV